MRVRQSQAITILRNPATDGSGGRSAVEPGVQASTGRHVCFSKKVAVWEWAGLIGARAGRGQGW